MAINKIADKVVKTDVLVVGGGIGGCCTAAKAREHGLNVILAEKSKTERSGSGGQGLNERHSYKPDETVLLMWGLHGNMTSLHDSGLRPCHMNIGASFAGRH